VSAAIERFFEHYYRRRPVNATFTGVHSYDGELPDWSGDGIRATDTEMRALIADLAASHPPPASAAAFARNAEALDAQLAGAFLEIQLAENAGTHGVRGNPSLWTGEAVFSVISLMIRDFMPLADRYESAVSRLEAIPSFLASARGTLSLPSPAAWTSRARRECEGAAILLSGGVEKWLDAGTPSSETRAQMLSAAQNAHDAFDRFSAWLAKRAPAPDAAASCGAGHYDLLLARGHWCARSRGELLVEAHEELALAERRLERMACEIAGSWPAAQEELAAGHPAPGAYLGAFQRTWNACRERAESRDVVTWSAWPIRYVTYPEWTAEAAPYLYYLFYRSPAPFDRFDVYDYVVPALPRGKEEAHLRAWNDAVIKLNHVVHHGAIGHHVQNWHAAHRAASRVGKVAAVDCASRLAMFCAGTMAEGWACYATALMEELDFLSPLERLSEAHSRVRFLARAIVDIEVHQGSMSVDDAVGFWVRHVGGSADAARNEATKASMFPCTAVIYWLGSRGIRELRDAMHAKRGAAFSLRSFHDELLGFGSIPVPLVARIMREGE
jgi:hypothetical protein